jgi:hypothetical protein
LSRHGRPWTLSGPRRVPPQIDIRKPSVARVYDAILGGKDNFPWDRAVAAEVMAAFPQAATSAILNRQILGRAVRYMTEQGIDQFLDLGSGIPTSGNVHEIAEAVHPDARTVYVDSDAVAYAHGRALREGNPRATYLQSDLRDPEAVLSSPAVTGFLDLSRPVAVLMLMTLHFVPDADDPKGIVTAYREAVAPGSYFVFSHGTNEYRPADTGGITKVYTQASHGIVPRDRAHIEELADGWELLEPGLVDVILWRPEPAELDDDPLGRDVTRYSTFAGVGRSVA